MAGDGDSIYFLQHGLQLGGEVFPAGVRVGWYLDGSPQEPDGLVPYEVDGLTGKAQLGVTCL